MGTLIETIWPKPIRERQPLLLGLREMILEARSKSHDPVLFDISLSGAFLEYLQAARTGLQFPTGNVFSHEQCLLRKILAKVEGFVQKPEEVPELMARMSLWVSESVTRGFVTPGDPRTLSEIAAESLRGA